MNSKKITFKNKLFIIIIDVREICPNKKRNIKFLKKIIRDYDMLV